MSLTSRNISAWLKILLSTVIWIPYLIYVYKFSSGLPFNDDYDMFLGSLINFENAQGLENKLTVLFSQHMEHRPAFPRMVAWLLVQTTGNCNFKILILIGNLMLMATTLLISVANRQFKLWQCMLLNATFILIVCGIQSKENIFWATGALQNYSLVFFATAAIYSASKNKYALSAVLGVLGICCSMSGFLIIPLVICMAAYQKKWMPLVYLAVILTISALLYANHYNRPDLSTLPGVTLHRELLIKFKYFFAFIGSFATTTVISLNKSIICGTLLFILTILLNFHYKKWDFWTFLSLFVLLNALAGVNSRSMLGAEQALSERYKIMSELLFICNLVKIFNYRFKLKTLAIVICFTTSAWVFYAQYRYLQSFVVYNKETTEIGVALFIFHKNPLLLKYPIPLAAAERLMKSEEMHIYTIQLND